VHQDVPILIIDSLMLFREGLRRIVFEAGFQCVWCSDQPPVTPLRNLADHVAPILIIGTELDEAGVAIRQVKKLYPACRVILLLSCVDHDQLVATRHSGANTMLLNSSSCETLLLTLKLVMNGVTVLPTDMVDALLEARELPNIIPNMINVANDTDDVVLAPVADLTETAFGLSERELSVLRGLRDGSSNKEIARNLGITEATVKVHVKAILRKAGVRNRTQVAVWSSKLGQARMT
jgi:two-component system, NarL family, nitrate/nitrite response regulator NarL